MDPALKPVLEREMEVYAAFMEHTDHHSGRLIDAIKDLGVYDDTLVYIIIGDNGASAEGTHQGAFNEMANFNGMAALETPEFMASKIDEFGSPSSYNHYAVGWAWAMDTPYQWTKQVASHWGGTRNGTIVRYPKLIKDKGGVRNQFVHVIDIAPTVLEAAGIPEPIIVHGVQQAPYQGTSMLYTFGDADAPERHDLQYSEMFGNRGIYHKGWSAVTKHTTPWLMVGATKPAFTTTSGSCMTVTDWTQAHDLSKENPDKLHELQRLGYRGDPLQRAAARRSGHRAGHPGDRRPPDADRRDLAAALRRNGPTPENSVVSIKNKSFSVTANVVVPDGGAEGTIIAQGGRFGGWARIAQGRAKFVYNVLGINEFPIVGAEPIPSGAHQVRAEFAYDGGGLGKGGTVTLYHDGDPVGTGRVEFTQAMVFSADETTDVGYESGTTVSSELSPEGSRFNGKIEWVQIDLGDDTNDHLIDPEERLKIVMARQ